MLAVIIGLLVWTEAKEYLWLVRPPQSSLPRSRLADGQSRRNRRGEPDFAFSVDRGVAHNLQLNFDATVATPCHYLTVDVRDAVGDRLHISDEFKKDGVSTNPHGPFISPSAVQTGI